MIAISRRLLLLVFVFFSGYSSAQVSGCTDRLSKNYDPLASSNDGSCNYPKKSIRPYSSVILNEQLHETSGLIFLDGFLWTHNDDTDTHLYALDTISGKIVNKIKLHRTTNTDWEEIAQDSAYVYMGDFGNNYKGNRKDLKILRIEKQSLQLNQPKIDTIVFQYPNQMDFSLQHSNRTNFDCEAMIATTDSLYLFTKEWKTKKTSLYSVSKIPGNYVADYKGTFNVRGLITGATFLENKKLLVLCGYSKKLKPFIYLLYDYKGNNFFSGNKRKIKLKIPFHQIEGIATNDGLHYYMSNENFTRKPFITVSQQLHVFDLTFFLKHYLDSQKVK
jgi:hypothetical protein